MTDSDAHFLQIMLSNPRTGWSMGTFGAIAEFIRDETEAVEIGPQGDSVATARGAIRIDRTAGLKLFAYELPAKDPAGWNHAVALCVPQDRALMNGRQVVTELGVDRQAIRAEDQDAVLFDIGLGTATVDVCVRSADPSVQARLRAEQGRSIFGAESTLMRDMPALSPARVFITRAGRAEVMQAVPDTHERSPEGPHTHVLPQLLKQGRTHSANDPVPEGFVPCAHLYPPHPLKDLMGGDTPFDAGAHEAFQDILRAYGDPSLVALKSEIEELVWSGAGPEYLGSVKGRHARATLRCTLRQLRYESAADCEILRRWTAQFEAPTV